MTAESHRAYPLRQVSIHTLAWRVTCGRRKDSPNQTVSIHTLAWRVTLGAFPLYVFTTVSIHTLAWRVTSSDRIYQVYQGGFNPHPRVEGDSPNADHSHHPQVSIHTLAWRVTLPSHLTWRWRRVSIHTLAWRVTHCRDAHQAQPIESFNPHPRVEGDPIRSCGRSILSCFNPHPRVEGDYFVDNCQGGGMCFNPHPRVEGDFHKPFQLPRINVSIHTLAWRVT